ncbi:Txe/YoeB family addiction module toxin [Propionimicrobium sp. PCR01-08-3]|uniref:Txe/YoeB family addiction module toxin n=1 Tax=Propionimicrobium sp. PCR01-08-3 TaxID=3052086 RepID=UPI00255C7B48|nr:Txe/YoeB family addiction module toxin [Propionimicrobium sp. PCR01-08-3]WIY83085.1 Txe/YoeB family addiction module toxin [Propionimicrobium sp. PCR01-08-3]
MKLVITANGWNDYCHWQETDRATLKRVNKLIDAAMRTPKDGIGKPEALKYQLGEVWSRRITEEHRLVYRIGDAEIIILQARFHYDA